MEKIIAPVPATTAEKPPTAPPGFAELTSTEKEVLQLIASGANNREIAQCLFITERTVKNHVTSILTRLNLREPPLEELRYSGSRPGEVLFISY